MISVLKIQLFKSLSDHSIDKEEADFLMSIINITSSVDDAIKIMLHISGTVPYDDFSYSQKHSLNEHIIYSNSILDKISNVEVTIEEIEQEL